MSANVHNRYASAIVATVAKNADGTVTMTWSNAGHPPPLLLQPGTAPVYLERRANLPLGIVRPAPERDAHSVVLPPGSTVLLYTDGLIERRGEQLDDGLQRLAQTADQCRDLPLPELAESLISNTSPNNHQDDTVLLALRAI